MYIQSLQEPDPTDQAYIVSEETSGPGRPRSWLKYVLVGGGLLIVLVSVINGVVFIQYTTDTFTQAAKQKDTALEQALSDLDPSSSFSSLTQVQAEEYDNPFDEQAQYANPFEETTNPFDEIGP